MPAAGQSAAAVAEEAAVRGGYVLAVEGGIPTAFNGGACIAWEHNGVEVTFADAVTKAFRQCCSNYLCRRMFGVWGNSRSLKGDRGTKPERLYRKKGN